jgi:hypothetical protein
MADSSNITDPDPISALLMSIWFTFLGVVGIPPNLFIVVATLKVKELRVIPANLFIGSLAFADIFLLFFFALHLPYALTSSEPLCKFIGVGAGLFGLVNMCIPPCLAINRYAVCYSQREKLARILLVAFSRKGIYLINFFLWMYQVIFNLPFVLFDTLGLQKLGSCGLINEQSENRNAVKIYYVGGVLGIYFGSYTLLLIFYSKVATWVKAMSAAITLTAKTYETLRETKSVMRLAKWITLIPLIVTSPTIISQVIIEINADIVSVRLTRALLCFYVLFPVSNAFLTLTFARAYRSTLKNISKKTKLTSALFLWVFEKNRIGPVEVTSGALRAPVGTLNRSFHVRTIPSASSALY